MTAESADAAQIAGATQRQFTYTTGAQTIAFGAGELARLGAHLEHLPPGRAILVTSGTYARNGTVERLRAALGERLVAVFDGVRPHVPDDAVAAALTAAVEARASMVIGQGGGSALGTAKALAVALHDQQIASPLSSSPGIGSPGPGSAPDRPLTDDSSGAASRPATTAVPLVAIPTTYAGSEMTPIYGVTRAAEGRKVTVTDARALPALVLYDPELTLDLPPRLTAETGINALAHCVEGVYSLVCGPVTTATALAGLAHIHRALPRCVADGRDLAARTELLTGAYLAGTTIANARIALHHGLCHVLGGSAGVPHGAANAIMLPHVMRFNAPACAPELAQVARALGVETASLSDEAAAARAVEAVEALIAAQGLARRLRDVGVDAADLPRLAALALRSAAIQVNPRPVTEAGQIEAILRAAW